MKPTLSLLSLLLLTSCQMGTEIKPEPRVWKPCNPAMIEDYRLMTEYLDSTYADIDKNKCTQVFEYVAQDGALECNFNEKLLNVECRPNTWYEGTGIIALTNPYHDPIYYKRVNPCEDNTGREIQGCSSTIYFTQLDTW